MKYLRPAAPVIAAAALAVSLTACGGSAPSAPSAQATSAPALPAVQPCDALDATAISKALGATVRIDTGTADAPVCFLRPSDADGAAFDLNYQWFYVNGLDDYFKSAKLPVGTLKDIRIAGADGAKLIVRRTKKAYQITGYVQNGALVQSVNGVGATKDADRILAATKLILTQLSAKGAPALPSASPSA